MSKYKHKYFKPINEYHDHDDDVHVFTEKLSEDDKIGTIRYQGQNVDWYGFPEQMIVIRKDKVHGRFGNIYSHKKLKQVEDLILNAEENVEFLCAYGLGELVDLNDIIEHQEAYHMDNFSRDFDGHETPYSIGNEELDSYLGNEDFMDNYMGHSFEDGVSEFFKDNKQLLANGTKSEEQIREEFYQIEYFEEHEHDLEEFINLEDSLREAVQKKSGDLGDFHVQMRDGHHRVFGSINAGEEFICLNLAKDDIPRFKGHYNKIEH